MVDPNPLLRVGPSFVFEGDDLALLGLPVPTRPSPRVLLRVTETDPMRGTITLSTLRNGVLRG